VRRESRSAALELCDVCGELVGQDVAVAIVWDDRHEPVWAMVGHRECIEPETKSLAAVEGLPLIVDHDESWLRRAGGVIHDAETKWQGPSEVGGD
jgi:hypothetical protein